jgi:hypothetical protein
VDASARDERRLDRRLRRLTRTTRWARTRRMLARHPELTAQAAADRLAALADRAERSGDLEQAVLYRFHQELIRRCQTEGADAAVTGLAAEAALVHSLVAEGRSAYQRFRAGGSQADLAAAVTSFERAAALTGPWHPDRAAILNNLGLARHERSSAPGRAANGGRDLDQAIAALEESAALARDDPEGRAPPLANLGSALLDRRGPGDLERAAEVLDEAARLAGGDQAERARRLNNLGIALAECHQHGGRPEQLERAVAAYEEAVALTTAGSVDRPARLANLGTGLAERFTLHGDPADLDRAIDLMAQAVAASDAAADPDLPDWLDNLGLLLRDRYLRDGDLADLDQAEARLARAVSLTAPGAAARPGLLDQHAATLRLRALRRGEAGELRRAVDLHREAARLTGAAADRAAILSNLGGTLRAWARQPGHEPGHSQANHREAILGEAVEAYREALGLARSAERGAVLTNLGCALLDRYDAARDGRDLDQAMTALTASVSATDPDSPDLPSRLNNLANGLRRRHERDGAATDAAQAEDAYRRGQRRGLQVATEVALRCGLNWGDWAAQRADWEQAREAYTGARVAADRLLRLHLARRDVEAWLTEVGDLPGQAAFARARTGEPAAAAEWLEWGRARVLSDALGRARLDVLAASRPDLVRRYQHAAARLAARDAGEPGQQRGSPAHHSFRRS